MLGVGGGNAVTVTHIDQERHQVRCGGRWRSLSPALWHLFEVLHRHRGHVVRSTTLFGVNGGDSWGRELIRLLRRRLAGSSFRIETHRTTGYELVIDEVERDRDAPRVQQRGQQPENGLAV